MEPLLRKIRILCYRNPLVTVVLTMLTWLSHLALSLFPHLGSCLSAALLLLSSENACTPCTPCTLYTMPGDREGLRVAQQCLQEEEEEEEEEEEGRTESASTTSAQPATGRRGTKSRGTGTRSAQPAMERKGTKSRGTGTRSAQPAMERKGTKSRGTGTRSAQPATGKRNQEQRNRHQVCTACHGEKRNQEQRNRHQVCTACHREERSPKGSQCFHTDHHRARAAQASSSCPRSEEEVQEQIHPHSDQEVAGPSHPAEEPEAEAIPVPLSLGGQQGLWRELAPQTNESTLAWDSTASDSTLGRQLASLSWHVLDAQGIRRAQGALSLWQ
ncbi:uncharacterized protein LOC132340164 isoform X1 [Haemorhous mexicanus]|uniref:uncharacterized protein LOC132340164 isoform X1 n=1 Tax=Haemorhous mexicanus TaxID=30427 RepID=UPI0028BED823|nr:uncharacterized protein LOC132340164 isoform X1 [Haemorhous mexicanus]XP_059726980.1 uncharacterized protein LOC132340164 isoform X1 [Haemorhous mexicanus]XP_059726990.1 uncharacterized protein LOC132340164 isoform X1 [Haemorhous mexicanus]XP_059726999.1 uncharacterized protein LOC132340164 isoform X1 [Haemorhous mexicanus]XP_059727008.1 uncharacterized protein LOC132340164 isoform X1 [Haemorhous mexicanus]